MVALMAAVALTAAGFTRAPMLETPASYVAAMPVQVMCATDNDAWHTELTNRGLTGNVWGFRSNGQAVIYIHPNGCRLLRLEARGKDPVTEPLLLRAGFIVTLVHESLHVHWPALDEGAIECEAMHEAPRVMVKFFHVKPGKMLRRWMAAAWQVHRTDPPQYQTVC